MCEENAIKLCFRSRIENIVIEVDVYIPIEYVMTTIDGKCFSVEI